MARALTVLLLMIVAHVPALCADCPAPDGTLWAYNSVYWNDYRLPVYESTNGTIKMAGATWGYSSSDVDKIDVTSNNCLRMTDVASRASNKNAVSICAHGVL